jgi:hypothetical protein
MTADDEPLARVDTSPILFTIKRTIEKNSLFIVVCARDGLNPAQTEVLLKDTSEQLDPTAVDEHSGYINLFALIRGMARAGARFENIWFRRSAAHLWEASPKPEPPNYLYRLVVQLKEAATDFDEIH